MLSYNTDNYLKIEYNPINNKHSFKKNCIGVHASVEIPAADYIYTDSNSIFVSNTMGSDSTGTGVQSSPYKTLLKAMNSCNENKMNVIVLDSYIYIENIATLTNIYFQGIYAGTGQTPKLSLRQYDNSYIPTDLNTIFVSQLTGIDTSSGTESSPVKTINHAITLLTASIQNILITDSETYIIEQFIFQNNVKNLRAEIGEAPIIKLNYTEVSAPVVQTQYAVSYSNNANTCVLSNTDFVLVYSDGYNATMKIYDKTGTTIKHTFSFGNYTNFQCYRFNNNFIFTYYIYGGSGCYLELRSNDGAILYSTSIGSLCVVDEIVILSQTRFLVYYYVNSGNIDGYVREYDETLTATGNVIFISGNTSAYVDVRPCGCLLSSGNFIVCYRRTSGIYAGIYNTSFVQQGSTLTLHSAATSSFSCESIGTDRFIFCYKIDYTTSFKIFDNSGSLQSTTQVSANSGQIPQIIPFENYSFAIAYIDLSTGLKISYYCFNNLLKTNDLTAFSYQGWGYLVGNFSRFSDDTILYSYAPYFKIFKSAKYVFPVLTDIIINGIEFDFDNVSNNEGLFTLVNSKIELYNVTVKNNKNGYPTNPDANPAYVVNSNENVKIRNCYFIDCDSGINSTTINADIQDNIFCRVSRDYAVSITGAATLTGNINIEHNTFFSCYGGVELLNNSGTDKEIIKNNIFHDNDIYDIFATNAQSYSYTCLTGLVSSLVSQGVMVIKANPLFIDEGNYNADDTDLDLRLRQIGYKVDSPAYGLGDDDRNCGAYDTIYIGALQTWSSATIEKPKKIDVWLEPVGGVGNVTRNGGVDTGVEGFTENIVLSYNTISIDDFNKFQTILMTKNPDIRLYPDCITHPTDFNNYKISFEKLQASPIFFKQSDLGVHNFNIKFSRKYE